MDSVVCDQEHNLIPVEMMGFGKKKKNAKEGETLFPGDKRKEMFCFSVQC